jgi:hypothetical protein
MNSKCAPKSPALGQHNPSHNILAGETGGAVELGHGLAVSDGFASEAGQETYERRRLASGGFEEGQEAEQ